MNRKVQQGGRIRLVRRTSVDLPDLLQRGKS